MIDKNNQFLESDNKQDTGEGKTKVNADDDPSRLVRLEVRQGSFPGNERIAFVRPVNSHFDA